MSFCSPERSRSTSILDCLSEDPRFTLTFVDIPEEFKQPFHFLNGCVLYFFGTIGKFSHGVFADVAGSSQVRVLALTDRYILVFKPNGLLRRCIDVELSISRLQMNTETNALTVVCSPPQYDLLLESPQMEIFGKRVSAIYAYWNPGRTLQLEAPNQSAPYRPSLKKPTEFEIKDVIHFTRDELKRHLQIYMSFNIRYDGAAFLQMQRAMYRPAFASPFALRRADLRPPPELAVWVATIDIERTAKDMTICKICQKDTTKLKQCIVCAEFFCKDCLLETTSLPVGTEKMPGCLECHTAMTETQSRSKMSGLSPNMTAFVKSVTVFEPIGNRLCHVCNRTVLKWNSQRKIIRYCQSCGFPCCEACTTQTKPLNDIMRALQCVHVCDNCSKDTPPAKIFQFFTPPAELLLLESQELVTGGSFCNNSSIISASAAESEDSAVVLPKIDPRTQCPFAQVQAELLPQFVKFTLKSFFWCGPVGEYVKSAFGVKSGPKVLFLGDTHIQLYKPDCTLTRSIDITLIQEIFCLEPAPDNDRWKQGLQPFVILKLNQPEYDSWLDINKDVNDFVLALTRAFAYRTNGGCLEVQHVEKAQGILTRLEKPKGYCSAEFELPTRRNIKSILQLAPQPFNEKTCLEMELRIRPCLAIHSAVSLRRTLAIPKVLEISIFNVDVLSRTQSPNTTCMACYQELKGKAICPVCINTFCSKCAMFKIPTNLPKPGTLDGCEECSFAITATSGRTTGRCVEPGYLSKILAVTMFSSLSLATSCAVCRDNITRTSGAKRRRHCQCCGNVCCFDCCSLDFGDNLFCCKRCSQGDDTVVALPDPMAPKRRCDAFCTISAVHPMLHLPLVTVPIEHLPLLWKMVGRLLTFFALVTYRCSVGAKSLTRKCFLYLSDRCVYVRDAVTAELIRCVAVDQSIRVETNVGTTTANAFVVLFYDAPEFDLYVEGSCLRLALDRISTIYHASRGKPLVVVHKYMCDHAALRLSTTTKPIERELLPLAQFEEVCREYTKRSMHPNQFWPLQQWMFAEQTICPFYTERNLALIPPVLVGWFLSVDLSLVNVLCAKCQVGNPKKRCTMCACMYCNNCAKNSLPKQMLGVLCLECFTSISDASSRYGVIARPSIINRMCSVVSFERFSDSNSCGSCNTVLLRARLSIRRHCQICGLVCCEECVKQTILLKTAGELQICNTCASDVEPAPMPFFVNQPSLTDSGSKEPQTQHTRVVAGSWERLLPQHIPGIDPRTGLSLVSLSTTHPRTSLFKDLVSRVIYFGDEVSEFPHSILKSKATPRVIFVGERHLLSYTLEGVQIRCLSLAECEYLICDEETLDDTAADQPARFLVIKVRAPEPDMHLAPSSVAQRQALVASICAGFLYGTGLPLAVRTAASHTEPSIALRLKPFDNHQMESWSLMPIQWLDQNISDAALEPFDRNLFRTFELEQNPSLIVNQFTKTRALADMPPLIRRWASLEYISTSDAEKNPFCSVCRNPIRIASSVQCSLCSKFTCAKSECTVPGGLTKDNFATPLSTCKECAAIVESAWLHDLTEQPRISGCVLRSFDRMRDEVACQTCQKVLLRGRGVIRRHCVACGLIHCEEHCNLPVPLKTVEASDTGARFLAKATSAFCCVGCYPPIKEHLDLLEAAKRAIEEHEATENADVKEEGGEKGESEEEKKKKEEEAEDNRKEEAGEYRAAIAEQLLDKMKEGDEKKEESHHDEHGVSETSTMSLKDILTNPFKEAKERVAELLKKGTQPEREAAQKIASKIASGTAKIQAVSHDIHVNVSIITKGLKIVHDATKSLELLGTPFGLAFSCVRCCCEIALNVTINKLASTRMAVRLTRLNDAMAAAMRVTDYELVFTVGFQQLLTLLEQIKDFMQRFESKNVSFVQRMLNTIVNQADEFKEYHTQLNQCVTDLNLAVNFNNFRAISPLLAPPKDMVLPEPIPVHQLVLFKDSDLTVDTTISRNIVDTLHSVEEGINEIKHMTAKILTKQDELLAMQSEMLSVLKGKTDHLQSVQRVQKDQFKMQLQVSHQGSKFTYAKGVYRNRNNVMVKKPTEPSAAAGTLHSTLLMWEAEILFHLIGDPCIVKPEGLCICNNRYYFLLLELAETDTQKLMSAGRPLPGLLQYAQSVLEGLATCHRKGVIHGNLHPKIVLVTDNAPFLSGFEFSVKENENTKPPSVQNLSISLLHHPPPELACDPDAYSVATDVFGFGVLLAEWFSGRHVTEFNSVTSVGLPCALGEMIQECLADSPSNRPSISELYKRVLALSATAAATEALTNEAGNSSTSQCTSRRFTSGHTDPEAITRDDDDNYSY